MTNVNTQHKSILFIVTMAVMITLTLFFQNAIPPGKDVWGSVSLGSGRLLQTRWEHGFITYNSDPLNEYDLFAIRYRFIQVFEFYLLGVFFQSFWHPFIFAWLLIGTIYTMISVVIYVLAFKLTDNHFIALMASILSVLSMGQLMLVMRVNLGESLGLLLMLISLTSYLYFLKNKSKKRYVLTLILCIAMTFTHRQPTVLFFSIIIVHQILLFFIMRPIKSWLKNTGIIAILITVVGLFYFLYTGIVRPGELSASPEIAPSVSLEPVDLPGEEMIKILGYLPITLSFFGVLLGWRKMNKVSFSLLLSWVIIAVIYPCQGYLGLQIIEPGLLRTRSFQEFYTIINIAASLGIYSLVNKRQYLFVLKRKIRLQWIAGCLLVMVVMMTSTVGYITDPSFTSIYPFTRVYTNEQYEALSWLRKNVSTENSVVIAEHNYALFISQLTGLKVLRLSDTSLSSFAGIIDYTSARQLEAVLNRVVEYWFSIGYNILLVTSKDMPQINIAPIFREVYENSEVRIYKGSPQSKVGVGPAIKVMSDSTVKEVDTYFEGEGPLNVSFTLSLYGSKSYRLFDIPSFLTLKRITPSPKEYLVDGDEVSVHGDNTTIYEVLFKGHATYPHIGWKDEFFSSNWIPLRGFNGEYSIRRGMLNISKTFKFGKPNEQFWVEKTIDFDSSLYPYLVVRFKGDDQINFQVALESPNEESYNVLPVYPAPSHWTIYIVKIDSNVFDKICLSINDFDWDIGGIHSVLVDYVMYAQYTPTSVWPEYYSTDECIIFDTSWHNNHGVLKPNATCGPQFVEGKFGNALHFKGEGDHVEIPHDDSLSFEAGEEITIALWANPDTVDSSRTFVSKRAGPSNFVFRIDSGRVEFYYRNRENTAWNGFITTDVHAEIGKWKHFGVTYTFGVGDTIRIFVNGAEVSGQWYIGSGYDSPFTSSIPVRIGAIGGIEQLFEGAIDEVRIYKRTLSLAEIQDLMEGKSISPGLVSEWLFEKSISP